MIAARLRRLRADDESGFALIYVLAITMMITLLIGSTLVVTTSSVVPSVQNAYSQAADSAAQSGLQAFVAYADQNCPASTTTVAACLLPDNYSGVVTIPTPGAPSSYAATYSWIAAKDPQNRYFRIKAVGQVTEGGVHAKRIIVGDVVGGATLDVLDYGIVTGFETQSSADVLADYPDRTIALDSNAITASGVPVKGGQIHWSGASPGSSAGKVAVCNATYDAKGGRGNLPPAGAPNPYVDWTESGLNGNNYTDYGPCHTAWGTKTKLLAAANPQDGTGGYYSKDALLLSKSYPGGNGPQFDQPVWTGWQYTSADAGICSTVSGQNFRSFNLQCAGYPVEVGGAPRATSLYPNVVYQAQGPQIPTITPTVPSNACVYAGPTRIAVNGSSAIVTSPQTTVAWIAANASSRPAQCYSGASANGMGAATVSFAGISVVEVANNGSVPNTTPATAHGSSGWPTTSQQLGATAGTNNSVFYLTNGTNGTSTATSYAVTAASGSPSYVPATGDNPSTKSDGAWKPQWTGYTTGSTCSSSTAFTDLKFANCYIPKGTYADSYSWLKAQVQAALAANPSAYTTSSAVQSLVNSFTSQGNSSDAANSAPSHADYTSHKWNVSVASGNANGCTQSSGVAGTTTDTPVSTPSSDPFYTNTAGDIHTAPSTDTSCYTATVSLQVGTCNVALIAGICVNIGNYVWGNGTALLGGGQSVAQFQVTLTVAKTTTTTTTTAATSTFPSMADVTQYQMGFNNTGNSYNSRNTFGTNGPGDLYIEGNASQTMSFVADDDVLFTGPTGPTGTNPASPSSTAPNPDTTPSTATSALEVVARNDVRVYHPVSCAVTDATMIANTSLGFCPDDITGLYTSLPTSGYLPYQQYVNMRSDLAGLTIHAAIFALGNADAHINCPQPPNGGGICGGEFTVDNYNRGASLGFITEIGTLAMAHHSPVGQEWEIPDATGASSRAYSGYQMAQQYQNLKALFAGTAAVNAVLQTTTSTSSLWHILSMSTGGTS